MDFADVIDLTVSPDRSSMSRRSTQGRRTHNPRKRPAVIYDDVIELTDSDSDEHDVPSTKKPCTSGRNVSDAGPSRPALKSIPTNELERQPLAGPSRISAETPSLHQTPKMPVFLPDDGATRHHEHATDQLRTANSTTASQSGVNPPLQVAPVVPPTPVDPIDLYLSQILDIVPDVDAEHALSLIQIHLPTAQQNVVQTVLDLLFDGPGYPKIDKKGKRKREETEDDNAERVAQKPKIDYASKDRNVDGGSSYRVLALNQLFLDFPYIPVPHVRSVFTKHNHLYAPSHLFLREEKRKGSLPYRPKVVPSRPKGKEKALQNAPFEAERQWLILHVQAGAATAAAEKADLAQQEHQNDSDSIECGCCFSTYPFDQMIQCPEAHLFCTTCMSSYASGLLGEHKINIVCMDQSGCKLPFSVSELRRFLTPKLMDLYDRVKQIKEIEAAGLENLEDCPFCEFKIIIENPHEKLFRCENQECGSVSCRACKKLDHLPKSCKEAEDDKCLDGRHTVEEAMTRALMRQCPKCNKAFVKDMGCNKMTCPHCNTMSCYVCRQVISGYDHFSNRQPNAPPDSSGKCALWDPVEQRHADEVAAAAKKAIDEYKRDHPDVNEKDIHVDLPPPPPPPPQPPQVYRPAIVPNPNVIPRAAAVAVHPRAGRYRPAVAHPPIRQPVPALFQPPAAPALPQALQQFHAMAPAMQARVNPQQFANLQPFVNPFLPVVANPGHLIPAPVVHRPRRACRH